MKRLRLISKLSPGDVVMLTAAMRDLHANHPGKYQTEVKTSGGAIWEHNPHVEKITDGREVQEIPCAYPLIGGWETG
jgi:ADP-heptose:LPS heptosyltransferase